MKLISHRGNLERSNPKQENHPDYIREALRQGFDVEVDIWLVDDKLWFGHDEPQYEIKWNSKWNSNWDYLGDERIWWHCKNLEALVYIRENGIGHTNFFWHQEDDFTLTSNFHIWTYPGKKLSNKSICVMPERASYTSRELRDCYGICSDNILKYVDL